jgi:DNA-binding NarL/FixJ family response regulator
MAAPASCALPLCKSQAMVARLVTQGKTNPQIAREMGTTLDQVRSIIYRIYENVGCSGRVQLAVWVTRYEYESAPVRYDGRAFTKRRNQ